VKHPLSEPFISDRDHLTHSTTTTMHQLLNGLRKESLSNIAKFLSFAHYVSNLKNEILVAQKSMHSPEVAPTHLPDSIVIFLVESCAMTNEDVEDCWQLIRGAVWEGCVPDDAAVDVAFKMFGKKWGFRESNITQ